MTFVLSGKRELVACKSRKDFVMNKLLIALTAGLLASSAVFAQAPASASTAPAAATAPAMAAPASATKAPKAKKAKKVRIHKPKQPASPVQVGPNGNKQ